VGICEQQAINKEAFYAKRHALNKQTASFVKVCKTARDSAIASPYIPASWFCKIFENSLQCF
jgi:hypothetical protein